MDWKNCILWTTQRSPFARRARIHLALNGIPFVEKRVDLFHLSLEDEKQLMVLNPLGRIPLLKFMSGDTLIDSSLIVKEAYSKAGASYYRPEFSEFMQKRMEVLALGLAENTVQRFLFQQMSKQESHPFLTDLESTFSLTLSALEQIQLPTDSLLPVHYDLGIALDYLCLRWRTDFLGDYPRLNQIYHLFSEQRIAQETAPEPPR